MGIVLSCIYGISLFAINVFGGLIPILPGGLLSWVGGFVVYGFGQRTENTDPLVGDRNFSVKATASGTTDGKAEDFCRGETLSPKNTQYIRRIRDKKEKKFPWERIFLLQSCAVYAIIAMRCIFC